jgi:hypothetical protein
MSLEQIKTALEECAAERARGFTAIIQYSHDHVLIDTRVSRNPSRRNNGGDYDFWLSVWPTNSQTVVSRRRCSCDMDWEPDYEPQIVGSGWKAIKAFIRAEARKMNIPIVRT